MNKNLASTCKIHFFNQSNVVRQNLLPEIAEKCLGTGQIYYLTLTLFREKKSLLSRLGTETYN